jgi:hypothetical protein
MEEERQEGHFPVNAALAATLVLLRASDELYG